MKLKIFDDFKAITKLREEMGADELGRFELFDPKRQITYNEREALDLGQLEITSMQVRILKDKTIAFKNIRLWLTWNDHDNYHLAACEQVQKRRHLKADFMSGIHQNNSDAVCLECLQLLKYEGLDARRSRRAELAELIQKEFKLLEFQKKYPANI